MWISPWAWTILINSTLSTRVSIHLHYSIIHHHKYIEKYTSEATSWFSILTHSHQKVLYAATIYLFLSLLHKHRYRQVHAAMTQVLQKGSDASRAWNDLSVEVTGIVILTSRLRVTVPTQYYQWYFDMFWETPCHSVVTYDLNWPHQ